MSVIIFTELLWLYATHKSYDFSSSLDFILREVKIALSIILHGNMRGGGLGSCRLSVALKRLSQPFDDLIRRLLKNDRRGCLKLQFFFV